jgi:hypothetical protein
MDRDRGLWFLVDTERGSQPGWKANATGSTRKFRDIKYCSGGFSITGIIHGVMSEKISRGWSNF